MLHLWMLIVASIATSTNAFNQARDTIKLDFGSDLSPTPWNNLNNPADGKIDDLLNSWSVYTGVSVSVIDSFTGINTNGTKAPAGELGLPASATGDSFFGSVTLFGGQIQPSGAILFEGLDPVKSYQIKIFASRDASDNRQAMYEINGFTSDTIYLNAASNSSNIATAEMVPDAQGTIRIKASPGPENTNASGFYYMGAVELIYEGQGFVAGQDTVLVDFGDNLSTLPWNNLADPAAGTISNMINAKGNSTPYNIAVYDAFNNINRNGTTSPDSSIAMPPTATGDSFFGNVTDFGGQIQPTGGFIIDGLDTSLIYSFDLFGSRVATDNRETRFEIRGIGIDSAFLNTASNVANLAHLSMKPDTSGRIFLDCSPGPNNSNAAKFYYIGAIRMMYEELPEPPIESNVDSILLDFGDNLSGLPWIDVIDPVTAKVTDLTTKKGKSTGYQLEITDAFNNINRAGTANPAKETGFPATASGDSFFGNVATFGGQEQPTGGLILKGLNPYNVYHFSIFASRDATDNREAMYVFEGGTTDTTYLDAASNTDRVAKIDMTSNEYGEINITVSPGPNNTNASKFFYLGAMIVDYEDQPLPSPFDTISIDFGSNPSPGPWINMDNARSGDVLDMVTSNNINSGYGIRITDQFNGINTNGTINPKAELGIPGSASGDSFYGNIAEFSGSIEKTGAIELYNLDTDKEYKLIIFASRAASDNRETRYDVVGIDSTSLFLNASSNTDSVVTATLKPKTDGTILVRASTGPNNTNASGFFYLGSLQVVFEGITRGESELTLLAPNGGEVWQQGRTGQIRWRSRNISEVKLEYSTDNGGAWKEIETVNATAGQYNWNVPNEPTTSALVRISGGGLQDQSDAVFDIVEDDNICRIVVLGSSTAEGAGASPRDSSWVNRYAASLSGKTQFEVINLGRGGYNTYNIIPTGTVSPGIGVAIDVERNITKALSLDPFVIIVNMPSNDAASNYGVVQQMRNFELIAQAAAGAGVELYVCTTQPRNFTNPALVKIQLDTRDSILSRFGDHAIDVWTGLADTMGWILPAYNSGDGVHLNNAGHRILFERVVALNLAEKGCSSVGVDEDQFLNAGIELYPNPGDGRFTLLNKGEQVISEWRIYDVMGRMLVRNKGTNNNQSSIPMEVNLPKGMYYLLVVMELSGKQGLQVLPIMIER